MTNRNDLYVGKFHAAKPKQYWWEPKEDITAIELAQCMQMLFTAVAYGYSNGYDAIYDSLPDGAKRHWRVEGGDDDPGK